ncbi:7-methylxanthosine synthase 1 [Glycine soja]
MLLFYKRYMVSRKSHYLSLKSDSLCSSSMEREQLSLHMNGGKGQRSYANNSSLQRTIIRKTRSILEETITRLYCDTFPNNCLKVADLGCSVGSNTLLVTSNIIDIVDNRSTQLNREPPTFQFYLNDLFGNDFNTIFKSLPGFYERLLEDKGHKFSRCFINATPGSFYGRLFPSNSINLFHSSYSLHWLSQDPLLRSREVASLNKGHCHIVSTSPPEVYKAYLKQFQQDFKLFLKSRSEELVPGGAMVLLFFGRDETPRRTSFEVTSLILNDMLLEGLIEEEKMDSFNIPAYKPTVEEIRHVIEEEGSFFVQRLEILISPWYEGINIEGGDGFFVNGNVRAEYITKNIRAVMEPLLSTKFGGEVINELFIRFKKKIEQIMEVEKLEGKTSFSSLNHCFKQGNSQKLVASITTLPLSFSDQSVSDSLRASSMEKDQLSLHMNDGKGEKSYANNSSLQRTIIRKTRTILEETIMRLLYCDSSPNCMKVADLGCSVGLNTLLVTSNTIDMVAKASTRLNRESRTLQYFISMIYLETISISSSNKDHNFGPCFINATPGSFYGRLFPTNSINFFHSSYSLHWLSQDPLLGSSEASLLNKGHCYVVNKSPPVVYNSYLKQFQQDFKLFLKSRSEELVPGGAIVLVLLGRNEIPRRNGWELISLILNDMFLEGLIEEEKLDSFNIPVYEPTVEEIRHVIQEEGSFFLQQLEILILPWDEGLNEGVDANIKAQFMAKVARAIMEPLLSAKFGREVIIEVFISASTERKLLLHMNGGKGERSYTNNCLLQKKLMLKAKPILEETIMRLYRDFSPNCMKVANLGCSVGPNALLVISNIIDIVNTACTSLNREPPKFQFYLNDLFGNGFNTIFKSLPNFYTILVEDKGHKFGPCFVNATPGSFYGRLFPSNSINLFHSSNSLHWLSQNHLTRAICHIVSTSPPEIYKAYVKQFQQDFKLFLKSRSEELVPGGAMVLVVLGNHETPRRIGCELVSLKLNDMFLEGLIEEEKLDSFNIPVYEPTVEEIRHVIEEEGSFFVQRFEILTLPWVEGLNEGGDNSFLDGNIKAR